MPDSTIPNLSLSTLTTGYFVPVALTSPALAEKSTLNDVSKLFNSSFFAINVNDPIYTDPEGLTYGRNHFFKGNLAINSGDLKVGGIARVSGLIAGNYSTNTLSQPNTFSTIAGGSQITNSSRYSFIGGGLLNNIPVSNLDYVVIGGGYTNTITVNDSSIVGGIINKIGVPESFIGGGELNVITGFSSDTHDVLVGGKSNSISFGTLNFIGGGLSNIMSGTYSVIVGGRSNDIHGGNYNSILGGFTNIISGGNAGSSAICAGNTNLITNGTDYGFIGAGQNNIIYGSNSFIGGGQANLGSGTHNVIGGGQNNATSGTHSSVPGGRRNEALADYSYAAGRRSYVSGAHVGAFVLSDSRDVPDKKSPDQDTITFCFQRGAYFSGTDIRTSGANIYINGVLVTNSQAAPTVSWKGPGTIYYDIEKSGCTADGNDTLLRNYILPANTMNNNGDRIKIRAKGNSAGSTSFNISLGTLGQKVLIPYEMASLGAPEGWVAELEFLRSGITPAHTIKYDYSLRHANTVSDYTKVSYTGMTFTSDNNIRISGRTLSAAANDITVEGLTVEYWPF